MGLGLNKKTAPTVREGFAEAGAACFCDESAEPQVDHRGTFMTNQTCAISGEPVSLLLPLKLTLSRTSLKVLCLSRLVICAFITSKNLAGDVGTSPGTLLNLAGDVVYLFIKSHSNQS